MYSYLTGFIFIYDILRVVEMMSTYLLCIFILANAVIMSLYQEKTRTS